MILLQEGGPVEEGGDLPGTPQSGQQSTNTGSTGRSNTGSATIGAPTGLVSSGVSYGLNKSQLGQIPGVTGTISPAITSAMSGASAEDIGYAALTGGVKSLAQSSLASLGVPGFATSTALGMAREAFRDDPNYGKAFASTALPGIVGTTVSLVNPVAGIVAGMLTGYATEHSLAEGILGDTVDSRTRESERDTVEDQLGLSTDDTSMMSRADTFGDLAGAFGFGLSDAFGSTSLGNLSQAATGSETALQSAAQGAFGDIDSLGAYADLHGLAEMEAEMAASRSSQGSDPRSSYGRGLNESNLLGDRELTAEQNMDRQPNDTKGVGIAGQLSGYAQSMGLTGEQSEGSDGVGAMGDTGGRSGGDPDGDAGSDPN